MTTQTLLGHLTEQRRQILVAVRPLPPARIAWNKALQAIIDTIRDDASNDAAHHIETAIRGLMLEITL